MAGYSIKLERQREKERVQGEGWGCGVGGGGRQLRASGYIKLYKLWYIVYHVLKVSTTAGYVSFILIFADPCTLPTGLTLAYGKQKKGGGWGEVGWGGGNNLGSQGTVTIVQPFCFSLQTHPLHLFKQLVSGSIHTNIIKYFL